MKQILYQIVLKAKLCDEAMAPSKLKKHFEKKHNYLPSKRRIYFERKLDKRKQRSQALTKNFTVSTKAQEASYCIAELKAKNWKPRTEAENLIVPSWCTIAKKMCGSE